MKKLETFVNDINCEETKKQDDSQIEEVVTINTVTVIDEAEDGEKILDKKAKAAERVKGKDAQKTGKCFGIAEPPSDEALAAIDLDSEDNTESMNDLVDKFDAEEDFFIVGRRGWGKSSIIESLAAKYHKTVITVYLDKAEASDLGGIPYVGKNSKGHGVSYTAMPEWAAYMDDHDDEEFLLFFDEMNQAQPDVMNALMPIVNDKRICGITFHNYFCGAAGNFKDENRAVNMLEGPLESRFKPLITWETHTPKSWKQAFKYLHKIWDPKLGKDVVDKLEENEELFDNPREIDKKLFRYIEKIKANPDAQKRSNPGKILRRLSNLQAEDLPPRAEEKFKDIAEYLYKVIMGENSKPSGRTRGKDINMVPQKLLNSIKHGITYGFMEQKENGKYVKYGISKENIHILIDLCQDDSINAEILQRVLNKFEADGVKWRFETDDQWRKAGYKDPNED